MADTTSREDGPVPMVGSELPEGDYLAIARLLRERRGFDLSLYKDRCVRRRIAKRMRAIGCHRAADYLTLLGDDAGELDRLLAALTIHISRFFRNPSTFRMLEEQVLPRLLEQVRDEGRRTLRLWSVGCAGGEEPYSLALLLEKLEAEDLQVEILGSDVNREVLRRAEEGLFVPTRLEEIPPQLLRRYFREEKGGYRLVPEIRRRVQFEYRDILSGEPYPKADLVLCRNVLIYFSREEQQRVLHRFAAALTNGGCLVLGRAEILLGESRDLFLPESPAERIYRRKNR